MFELKLSAVTATLEHLNTRTEKSGPDDVPAATIEISCNLPAAYLKFFSPTLEQHLFDTEAPKDLAGGMSVRYPHLDYPLALDHEMTGAKAVIAYGVDNPMELPDSVINKFRITPWDGGTVVFAFKVNCKPDAFKQLPYLYIQQKKGITFTLEPAELKQMKDAA